MLAEQGSHGRNLRVADLELTVADAGRVQVRHNAVEQGLFVRLHRAQVAVQFAVGNAIQPGQILICEAKVIGYFAFHESDIQRHPVTPSHANSVDHQYSQARSH